MKTEFSNLVPRPVRAIRVTRGGLEPSVLGKLTSLTVTSHPKSPRTTGNEAESLVPGGEKCFTS